MVQLWSFFFLCLLYFLIVSRYSIYIFCTVRHKSLLIFSCRWAVVAVYLISVLGLCVGRYRKWFGLMCSVLYFSSSSCSTWVVSRCCSQWGRWTSTPELRLPGKTRTRAHTHSGLRVLCQKHRVHYMHISADTLRLWWIKDSPLIKY